jgi:hypothetical protein
MLIFLGGTIDARIQGLRASKVHIVARRLDPESWADASKYLLESRYGLREREREAWKQNER